MADHENSTTIIFPHQLFLDHPGFSKTKNVLIVEDQLFFDDYKYDISFHKKKLVLHRASMKAYQDYLKKHDFNVKYADYKKDSKMSYIFDHLKDNGIKKIYYAELVDYALEKRIKHFSKTHKLDLCELESPGFLNSREWIENYFKDKKSYFMTSFYIEQRKMRKILLKENKPLGGKWSFDKENRRKIPNGMDIPSIPIIKKDNYIKKAQNYVEDNFPLNPGELYDFNYPITHKQAHSWFEDFLVNRFNYFGDFEDSIDEAETFLFHSVISSSLNIGLITPTEILDRVLKTSHIKLNSMEGYIRQIIGWREFMRAIYLLEGERQRTKNFLNNHRSMGPSLYYGETGLHPYDKVVERVKKYAYAHHIERLMILGNLMLLMDIHPDEVYKWFMEMFIDSYDWVMVPNVYGMSQYADGALITTKPYFSSSNYLRKMSNFSHGDWEEIWDALFWRFVKKHRKILEENPRLRVITKGLEKKEKMEHHKEVAAEFLKNFEE
ncbi:MAG: cryptochrome/photolyase family protein [Methanobacteriaceae archaeon]|nr:cryptochrome/photolyase family protein [Methanobacteriaceae archaeon]